MKEQLIFRIALTAIIIALLVTCSKLNQTNLQSAPEIPSDPVPADSAQLSNLDFEFSWTCTDIDGDPITYNIYLDTIAAPAIYDSLIDTTSYLAATLSYNATYYWQVVATDSSGLSTEGPVWSFTLGDDEVDPTVMVSAPNGAELWYVGEEYDITWEAVDDDSVASYKLEYSTDDGETWFDIQDWTDGNPQTYSWEIPATPSARSLARVSCQDFAGNITSDLSDTLFTAWPEGGMIVFTSDRDGTSDIFTMFADGSNQINLTADNINNYYPVWSHDCSKIAFTSDRDVNREIYVMNSDGTNQVNLSNNPGWDRFPAWSPNGDKIAFSTDRTGNHEIYVMNTDGSEQYNLSNNPAIDYYCNWSPTGEQIAFHSDRGANCDIYVMDNNGSNQIRITTHTAVDAYPDYSPNGLQFAFRTNIPGNDDIYVMNIDGSNQHNISNHSLADHIPKWSPDGQSIVFYSDRSGDSEIYIMNTDGTNLINVSNTPTFHDWHPDWSPVY